MNKILLFAFLLLTGCATEAGYQKIVNSWMGSTKHNLIESWGTPTSNYKEDEHTEYFDYVETSITGDSYGNIYNWQCKTTFTIRDNVITSWRYEGNNCVACNDDFWGFWCKL